jgi:hypothetical protein
MVHRLGLLLFVAAAAGDGAAAGGRRQRGQEGDQDALNLMRIFFRDGTVRGPGPGPGPGPG